MNVRRLTIALLCVFGGIIAYFLICLWFDGMRFWGSENLEYDKTGQVGDFIGGVIGTLINGAAFYFLYLTLQEQKELSVSQNASFIKERFETNFFELLKIHRDNVAEMRKEVFENSSLKIVEGRKVIQVIVADVFICREEIKSFFRRSTESDIYDVGYARRLKDALKNSNPDVDLIKLAKVNIPYCIVFFGVDAEGRRIIESLFEGKYNPKFYKPILDYASLKPVKDHLYYRNWKDLLKISDSSRRKRIASGIRMRRRTSLEASAFSPEDVQLIEQIWYRNEFTKYYGGNQYRLGHYFRQMFQMIKLVDKQQNLSRKEKYFYTKTLRAQLSTHEQVLLFINSLSFMGMVWELTPKFKGGATPAENLQKAKSKMFITNYQMIKNIPNKNIFGFNIPDFYPGIELENSQYVNP